MATRFRPLTLSAAHYIYLAATLLLLGSALGMFFEPEIRTHLLGDDGRQDDVAPDQEPAAAFPADSLPGGGPPGGDVFSITIDPRTPATVYAVTFRGVFKSVDGGTSWKSVGHFPHDFGMPAVTIDPSDSSLLFVPVSGEVFKTTNGGESWQRAEAASQQDRASSRLLYAWAHNTVHQSRDGGKTWRDLRRDTDLGYSTPSAFASDSSRPSLLYVGDFGKGILKSVDGGETWKSADRGLPADGIRAIAIDPSNPAVVYAGLDHSGVFRADDGGGSWTEINLGLWNRRVHALAIDPSRPATVYAGTDEGVFKSVDAGANWRAIDRGLTSRTVYALAVDPSHTDVLYAGCMRSGGVFKSTDGGGTWFPARSGLDATEAPLLVQGRGAASLYAATGEEVFAYRGGRWFQIASVSDVLGGEVVSALAVDPTARATIYAGTRNENGSSRPARIFRSTNGGATWSAADAGVKMGRFRYLGGVWSLAVEPSNGAVWASAGGLFSSHDSGTSWTEVRRDNASLEFSRVVMDPTRSGTLYLLQSDHLLKSTDRGTTWTFADSGLPGAKGPESISSVVVHPATPDVLYSIRRYFSNSTDRHALYRSTDGGASWVPLGGRLGRAGLSSLAIDPGDPRTLLGSTGESVLRSVDGGATWSKTAGLPASGFIRAIVFDTALRATVYASTTSGVFMSTDAGVTWRPTDSR